VRWRGCPSLGRNAVAQPTVDRARPVRRLAGAAHRTDAAFF
jgi:hypothetical protein